MPKDSAALCLQVEEDLFFIKRRDDVPTHKGQIAFIGGHCKKDEISPIDTIKREFEEESGLSADLLEFIQELPLSYTRGQKKIHPWYAKIKMAKKDFILKVRANSEWDQYFLVPIKELHKKHLWQNATFYTDIKEYEVLYFPFLKDHFSSNHPVQGTPILWGATARMVWNFITR